MENRDRADDDIFKDWSGNGNKRKESTRTATTQTADSTEEAKINENDLEEEFSSDLALPSGSLPYTSMQHVTSNANDNDIVAELLEQPTSGESMPSPGLRMEDSMEMPQEVGPLGNHDVDAGAYPVPSSRHDSTQELANEESKQDEELPNSAEVAHTNSARDNSASLVAAESGLYTVEAQLAPDGNEEETMVVAEAKYVPVNWYQRPLYRWILGFGLVVVVVVAVAVIVVLVVRPPAATDSIPLMSPTPAPTSLPPELIACNFLSIPNVTECRSIFKFSDKTSSLTIPSEIGVLTQLTLLDFTDQSLASSIPSEIGLLKNLTFLSLSGNALTSTIPSETGLLTQLTYLDFSHNLLTSTIPSEIGLLTQVTDLRFTVNKLTSNVPSEIGLLTQLRRLDFFTSSLTSTIPSEIGRLTQLTFLDFSFNSLTSTIPSEIGLLQNLTQVYFSFNLLASTVPSEIGLLTQLMVLDFSFNSLTSTIPIEIGLLTQLTTLDFSFNSLNGTIPSSLCSLPSLNSTISIDCGEITCAPGCCRDTGSAPCG